MATTGLGGRRGSARSALFSQSRTADRSAVQTVTIHAGAAPGTCRFRGACQDDWRSREKVASPTVVHWPCRGRPSRPWGAPADRSQWVQPFSGHRSGHRTAGHGRFRTVTVGPRHGPLTLENRRLGRLRSPAARRQREFKSHRHRQGLRTKVLAEADETPNSARPWLLLGPGRGRFGLLGCWCRVGGVVGHVLVLFGWVREP